VPGAEDDLLGLDAVDVGALVLHHAVAVLERRASLAPR
jgi:hypothetical protein